MLAQVKVRSALADVHRRADVLRAVLLNPVVHERETITLINVQLAATALNCSGVTIANINVLPTADLPQLSMAAATADSWRAARPGLRSLLEQPGPLLFAWGLGGLTGPARALWREQIAWVSATAIDLGRTDALQLDGRPRHPSRWRQYLGPVNGRYAALPTFAERLAVALKPVPLMPGPL